MKHLWPIADQLEALALRPAPDAPKAATPVFRGAVAELHRATDHEIMVAGPAETGKTFGTLWHLDTVLRRSPRAQGAMVRKVASDIGPTVLRTYLRVVGMSGSGATAYGGNSPQWFDYPNGARLYIGGMDRPGKVLSGERDIIYVNQAEELTGDDWQTLTTRATGRGAVVDHPQVIGDCNPGAPHHWILQRPSLRVLHSRHADNPTLYDDAGGLTEQGKRTMAVLENLTGVLRLRLYLGQWVSAEGMVYDLFDRATHLIDPFPIPASWMRIRSIDFGYTNPFVCQWWALDGDGRMYLYREIYMTGRTIKRHAETIRAVEQWHLPDGADNPDRERITLSVADHDAEDRATLAEERIGTHAAEKAVSRGIQKVQERLVVAGDGRPRLFIFRNALVERDQTLVEKKRPTCTAEEFESYVWPKGQDGRPVKEMPVKEFDHGMDALRYAVMRLDGSRGNSAVGAFG